MPSSVATAVTSEAFIESLSKTAETAVFAAVAEAAVAVQVAVAEAEAEEY